jgi:hypothetical protein
MSYAPITTTEIAVGRPITNALMTKVKDSLDWVYNQTVALPVDALANGSFEGDSDGDGTPDSWTWGVYAGGSKSIETSSVVHGAAAIKFTHPGGSGNGGGWAQSDYVPVHLVLDSILALSYYATAAGMKVMVEVAWYDAAKALISTSTPYTSTANPTGYTALALTNLMLPSSLARYCKVKLIGGYTDTDVVGSVYFDDVRFVAALPTARLIQIAETIDQIECSTGSNPAFSDIGSTVAITVPAYAYAMVVPILAKASGGGTATFRARLDTTYSAEVSTGSSTYVTFTLAFSGLTAGAKTFSFQAHGDGTATAYLTSFAADGRTAWRSRRRVMDYSVPGSLVDS